MHGLERLTLAYPNPEDAIFSVAGPSLKHLSLRDYPRHYVRTLVAHRYEMQGLAMPILSSSECLRVLSRMSMPRLEHLELVYEADGLEEDLLVHVSSTYPQLQSLELHQYRSASHGSVALRFDRVSEILSLVKILRTVYLNLDYKHEDNMMFDPDISDYKYEHDQDCLRWPSSTVLERYGSALLAGMERLGRCPVLEGLYLLYFDEEYDDGHHRWVRFLPSRYPGMAAA